MGDSVVVLCGCMAGPKGEEDHVDDDFIHGWGFVIEHADKTDIAGLYIDVTSIGHTEVESAKSKEHSVHTIKPLWIGHTAEAYICAVQTHSIVLDKCHHVVVAYWRVKNDSSQANLGEIVVVLDCNIVLHSWQLKISLYVHVVIESNTIW